jgi:hypothetical protein
LRAKAQRENYLEKIILPVQRLVWAGILKRQPVNRPGRKFLLVIQRFRDSFAALL